MPGLTPQVWDKLGRRPALLAFHPWPLEHQLQWVLKPPVNTIVTPFPAEQLVGDLCYKLHYADSVAQLSAQLARIRSHFELGDEVPLRVAIIGNESRMAAAIGTGDTLGCEELGTFMVNEAVAERKFGGLVEAALRRLGNIVLCPMNELPGASSPKLNCPRAYWGLVRKVRAGIGRSALKRLSGEPGTMVKLPAAVRLFVRRHRWSRWRPLALENPHRARIGEADFLIDAFNLLRHDARETNRRLPEGVLMKVFGKDADRHCIADSPMLTASQHELARDAGIEAIVLDTRGVIWNVAGEDRLDERADPPVYGA
jgi:hypothetical protein